LPKRVTKLSNNIWVWDLGSGKNILWIPGSRGQRETDNKIRIRNTAYKERKFILKIGKLLSMFPLIKEIISKHLIHAENKGNSGS
jgi:hypothetical protein